MHPEAIIHDVEQGSDEWHQARNGLITASEVKLILTPTLKKANTDKTRAHAYELAAQRISGYTEPSYIGDEMLRGQADEITARDKYSEHFEPVEEMGFITRNIGGGLLGYSPDGAGVMGDFGIEIKSRRQKFQVQTIAENEIPTEHIMQVQAGLLVTGWDYIDYVQYCGGLPMWRVRCEPIETYQEAITEAVIDFEVKINDIMRKYYDNLKHAPVVIETEREEIADDVEVYVG